MIVLSVSLLQYHLSMNKKRPIQRRTLTAILATIVSIAIAHTNTNATSITLSLEWCTKKTFITTAYYSPKPGQIAYAKGNLSEEKILNGEWTHGASGMGVFNGMIAAPSSYEFGEYIIMPSLGIGVIADRWWAIVKAGERNNKHDRLDIYMWEWNEGLIKAITRWKKETIGYHCPQTMSIPQEAIGFNLEKVPTFKYFFDMAFSMIQLEEWRKDIFVRTLQKYMNKLGYLDNMSVTWYFGPKTKQAICNFQVDNKLLNKNSQWCWIFGPQTRYTLNQKLKESSVYPNDFRTTTDIKKIVYEGKRINTLMNK